jgi:hypothetical protein
MGLGDRAPLRQATEKSGYSKVLEITPVRGDWLVVDAVRPSRSAWRNSQLTGKTTGNFQKIGPASKYETENYPPFSDLRENSLED